MFYNIYGDINMNKYIMHIDVNNAFLSWTAVEMLKNGKIELRVYNFFTTWALLS